MVGDRDGHEPLPALQALLRAHEALVHDRAARGRLPDHDRRLQAPAQRHGLRRAGRRRDLRRPLDWTVPFNGRILSGGSHHHGGATRQTLVSKTCSRGLLDAKAYYGAADHPYNTVRPILHEPGPIANGTFTSAAGIPITAGEVLERTALSLQLLAARGGDGLLGALRSCATTRVTALRAAAERHARRSRARRSTTGARRTSTTARCRSCSRRPGAGARSRRVLPVGDQFFRPPRMTSKVGERITWRFAGVEPHSVTVANGPRGFSSNYLGQRRAGRTRSRRPSRAPTASPA